ncbi:MAG: NAD-dependent epimerase/dehydratase family protein [Acidobacteria bacterium]|nr:NAD-dependent epimerase/dehydratase family protein [Acidobacteriota bacterium]
MKVLVTGGCGFLGPHICESFLAEGADVIAYDNMTKYELLRTGFGSDAVRDHNANALRAMGVQVVVGDVRDQAQLLDYSSGCNFSAHTAAQPAMTISWENPELDFTTNAGGTVNVLMAARGHNVPVASCSSVHVYGPWINDTLEEMETRFVRNPVAIKETDPIMNSGKSGRLSPVHASKSCGEFYTTAFADMYGVKAAAFRFTGIYGSRQLGGEDHGWVANFALRNFLGWPLTVYGTGKQLRDILYASDAAAAFVAYQKNPVPGTYNIGGGPPHMTSLLECIQLIDRLGGRASEVRFGPVREGDLAYFVCDIERARNAFGWQPRVKPEEGVGMLMQWIEDCGALFRESAPAAAAR